MTIRFWRCKRLQLISTDIFHSFISGRREDTLLGKIYNFNPWVRLTKLLYLKSVIDNVFYKQVKLIFLNQKTSKTKSVATFMIHSMTREMLMLFIKGRPIFASQYNIGCRISSYSNKCCKISQRRRQSF